MSIRHMTEAWNLELSPTTKLVSLCLADYADGDGLCWPSHKTISKRTGLSRTTVIKSLNQLIEMNLLQKVPDRRRDGSTTSNLYYLNLSRARAGDLPQPNNQNYVRQTNRGGTPSEHPLSTKCTPGTVKEPSIDPLYINSPNISTRETHRSTDLPKGVDYGRNRTPKPQRNTLTSGGGADKTKEKLEFALAGNPNLQHILKAAGYG